MVWGRGAGQGAWRAPEATACASQRQLQLDKAMAGRPKTSAMQRRKQAKRAEAEGRKAKGTWAQKHSDMRLRRKGRALWAMLREFNAEDAEEAVEDHKCPEWCAKREAKAKPALVPRPPSTPPPPWKLHGPPRARVPPPPPPPPRRADSSQGATTGPSLEPQAKPWPVAPPWRRAVGSEGVGADGGGPQITVVVHESRGDSS